uniref:Uncharacterized protein n=1 Tax=Rhizophora mucronata TaxID=61149 RepID=A0A2P2PH19_RHIMU
MYYLIKLLQLVHQF